MPWWRRLMDRLTGRADRDLERELHAHLDLETEEQQGVGLRLEEARYAARRVFGNTTLTKEEVRQMWGAGWVERLMQDVKYAPRLARKNPGFAAATVLTLTLGIGANTTVFSVVNAVLLRPLPYKDPDRLVMVFERLEKASSGPVGFSPPDFAVFEREQKVFVEVAAFGSKFYELSGVAEPQRITGARVSATLFSVLGVSPAFGRTFTPDEDQPGRNVVVLSARLWRRKYGADPSILGKDVRLDRQPYTVVGIMPDSFEFPHRGPVGNNEPAELWVPMAFAPEELRGWTSSYNYSVLARLKPGITLARARLETTALAGRIEQEFYPPSSRSVGLNARVEPFQDEVTGRIRGILFILQGAVALVLLIACAAVANLLLTRAATRSREMAIRAALGAGRRRLVRQVLLESLPLALAGGVLGLILSWWAISLVELVPVNIPLAAEIRIDRTVLAFTLLLCCGTTVLFGLAPAIQISRFHSLADTLKESSRGATAGRSRQRLLGFLVAAQFAVTLVLLVGAGLLIRTFTRLLATDPGFHPENVLSLSVSLPGTDYRDAVSIRSFYQRLLGRLETLPGVKAVGAGTCLPLAIRERRSFTMENPPAAVARLPKVIANVWVMGDYLGSLGVRLKRGRFLTPEDGLAGEPVVVINETMARRYFPAEDPIGRRIKWGGRSPWMTIVGVVEDVKHGPLRADVIPETFEPYLQVPDAWIQGTAVGAFRSLSLIVRASVDPAVLVPAVRSEIRALDPQLPIVGVQTLEQYVQRSVRTERFHAIVMAIFAGAALFLAIIGIYGVLSYSVTQRTHEIGVRLALGTPRGDVLRQVISRGLALAGIGIALGLLASLAFTRVLGALLYGVTARDPVTFAVVVLLLGAVAVLACYLPARRAARVDPVVALRYE